MPRLKSTTKKRFELVPEMIAAHGDSNSCLVWPYNRNYFGKQRGEKRLGHGQFLLPGVGNVYVHRYAFFLANGRWPEDKLCHSCDNPACFNLKHLFEGTQKDNVKDCIAKGRFNKAQGAAHGMAVLSEQQVHQIRARPHDSLETLAAEFQVGRSTIYRIRRGHNWKALPRLNPV